MSDMNMKVTTCDWCSREAPVQTVDERLWRFWGVISKEDPLIESLRNICEECKARYEGFSNYIDKCKSNESIIAGIVKVEPSIDIEHHPLIKEEDEVESRNVPFPATSRSVVCPLCNKTYANPSVLKTHLRVHTGERPFECSECDRAFARSHELKSHLRVHTGERPFKCSQCDWAFTHPSHLKRHTRVHTGEKPYRCIWCERTFAESRSLKKHSGEHTGDKSFKCSQCDKTFVLCSDLMMHSCVHTGERLDHGDSKR